MRQSAFLTVLLLSGLSLSLSCGDNLPPDIGETDNTSSGSTCAPTIKDLAFIKGESDTIGPFVTLQFTYKLHCGRVDDGASVRVNIADTRAPEESKWYDLPVTSSYVAVDTGAKEIGVDFTIPDETTEYAFKVKLVDDEGYVSNTLENDVVWDDLDDGEATETPTE